MASETVFAAHLLKRTRFYVSSEFLKPWLELSQEQMLVKAVDNAVAPKVPGNIGMRNIGNRTADKDAERMLKTELGRLNGAASGLGDRMLWFWHGLITTSHSKVYRPGLQWRQHQLLGKHALGSFRDMLVNITVDPAMLSYLDGDGSPGEAPNENYARELMELFTMGRGFYQQSDVRAAAQALSGWYTSNIPENGYYAPGRIRAIFDADSAYQGELQFLGKTFSFDADTPGLDRVKQIIEQILIQPATARFIVGKLFHYFIHGQPSEEVIEALAQVFRSADYQIKPLLSALFRHSEFTSEAAMTGRGRLPLEWLLASVSALGLKVSNLDFRTYLSAAAQDPFDPPNVAGWPLSDLWLGVPQAMARHRLAVAALRLSSRQKRIRQLNTALDPLATVLSQLSITQVSEQTHAQLQAAASTFSEKPSDRSRLLLALALASPEFALT